MAIHILHSRVSDEHTYHRKGKFAQSFLGRFAHNSFEGTEPILPKSVQKLLLVFFFQTLVGLVSVHFFLGWVLGSEGSKLPKNSLGKNGWFQDLYLAVL